MTPFWPNYPGHHVCVIPKKWVAAEKMAHPRKGIPGKKKRKVAKIHCLLSKKHRLRSCMRCISLKSGGQDGPSPQITPIFPTATPLPYIMESCKRPRLGPPAMVQLTPQVTVHRCYLSL